MAGAAPLANIVPRFPERPVIDGRVARRLAGNLDWRGTRVALSNLEAAFGDRSFVTGRADMTRQSYQQFVRTMIDLFWVPALTVKISISG